MIEIYVFDSENNDNTERKREKNTYINIYIYICTPVSACVCTDVLYNVSGLRRCSFVYTVLNNSVSPAAHPIASLRTVITGAVRTKLMPIYPLRKTKKEKNHILFYGRITLIFY